MTESWGGLSVVDIDASVVCVVVDHRGVEVDDPSRRRQGRRRLAGYVPSRTAVAGTRRPELVEFDLMAVRASGP